MKWFYNLRRLYRNIIAGALWGVLLLVAGIAGGIYGDNVDNMHPAVAVVVVALLVGAIVFTVFASIATKNERRANKRIGRIKKELAFELLDQFGKGFSLDGEITDITGGTPDAPTYGCNIIIYKF